MAASRYAENGEKHVGWVDENGNFTDVSEKVNASSGDFGGLYSHSNPKFSADGQYFFFAEVAAGARLYNVKIKRVPVDNLTPDAVEEVGERPLGDIYYLAPDNSIDSTNFYYDESMRYPAESSKFNDWISANTCLGSNRGMIYKYTISEEKERYSFDNYTEKEPLAENVTGRVNTCPIISPEKDSVAFLSQLTNGTDTNRYLFIVPLDGGEPVKVNTPFAFSDGNGNPQQILLGWK